MCVCKNKYVYVYVNIFNH